MVTTAKKINFLKILLGFFLFVLGIVIGIAVRHYNNIPIAETFNIVDVATLITTIFIAVYVPSILNKNLQIRQEKKDLINHRIDDLQTLYRRVNTIVQQNENTSKDKIIVSTTLDIISNRLDTIILLLSYLDSKNTFREEIGKMKTINAEYQTLLLSENEKQNFTSSVATRQKEESLYNEMDKVSSLLLFKLSDM